MYRAGGLVGAETAIYLADLGHEVTVVEMNDTMAAEANMHHGTAVRQMLDKLHIKCLTSTKCVGVKPGAIDVEDAEGKRSTLTGDTIVLSAGYRAGRRRWTPCWGWQRTAPSSATARRRSACGAPPMTAPLPPSTWADPFSSSSILPGPGPNLSGWGRALF